MAAPYLVFPICGLIVTSCFEAFQLNILMFLRVWVGSDEINSPNGPNSTSGETAIAFAAIYE